MSIMSILGSLVLWVQYTGGLKFVIEGLRIPILGKNWSSTVDVSQNYDVLNFV